jgi:hypothetical protein
MEFQGMGFVTHREVESLLGGGVAGARQRARLTERGWLPEVHFIRADRHSLAIYPEFCLAALVVPGAAARSLGRPIELAAQQARRLFGSLAYRDFAGSLAKALRQVDREDVVGLAGCAVELDFGVFSTWRDEVLQSSQSLIADGVEVEALAGRVAEVGSVYIVEFDGRAEEYLMEAAPQLLEAGALVTRDRVRVASRVRDFLLPVPEVLSVEMSPAASGEQDEFTRMLFAGLEDEIRVLPELGAAREAVAVADMAIDIPWHLLAGGNSMSRRVS